MIDNGDDILIVWLQKDIHWARKDKSIFFYSFFIFTWNRIGINRLNKREKRPAPEKNPACVCHGLKIKHILFSHSIVCLTSWMANKISSFAFSHSEMYCNVSWMLLLLLVDCQIGYACFSLSFSFFSFFFRPKVTNIDIGQILSLSLFCGRWVSASTDARERTKRRKNVCNASTFNSFYPIITKLATLEKGNEISE